MLTTIVFDEKLNSKNLPYLSILKKRLRTEGFAVLSCPSDTPFSIVLPPNETAENCLLLSSQPALLSRAKEAELACVGVVRKDSDFSLFQGITELIQSGQGLRPDFFRKVYAHTHSLPFFICETKRFYLREFTVQDFEALYALSSEPSVRTSLTEPLLDRKEEYQKHLAYLSTYPFFELSYYGIFEKETNRLIGRAGFSSDFNSPLTYSLGYSVTEEKREQGVATECVRALLQYAKSQSGLSLFVTIKKNNTASLRVMQKSRFHFYPYSYQDDCITYAISSKKNDHV